MFKAEIYDFDGLIIDSETPEYLSWKEQFNEHGIELPVADWVKTYVGKGAADISVTPLELLQQLATRQIDEEEIRIRRRSRYAELIRDLPLKPGIEHRLASAKSRNVRLAIASSSTEDWIAGHLSRLGILNCFEAICSADKVSRTKPDPELYLMALTKLDTEPSDAVAFEDSPRGAEAAHRAGITTVAVPSGLTSECTYEHAALVVSSIGDPRVDDLLGR